MTGKTDNIESAYAKRVKRWKIYLTLLVIALFLTAIVSLNLGYKFIPFPDILAAIGKQIPYINSMIDSTTLPASTESIIVQVRLPRIVGGIVIGAGLAASGVLYQGVFRNPMADSFVLGVSTGASVGAGIGILLGSGLNLLGLPFTQVAAFIAALVTVFVVYNISRVGSRVPEMTLLLSGLAITFFLSAVFQIMQVLAPSLELHGLVSWTIGGIASIGWNDIWKITPLIIAGIVMSYFYSRELNMISLGSETAQHLGVNTERTKKILLSLGALMTAAAVSISGAIGFVGLMIPHMTRLIMGPDHRLLLPASVIVGAIFLVICDAVARVITGAAEVPVGIITALTGGPFFIFLLRKKKLSYRM